MALAYDMLVIDLDGTLMRKDGSISPRNRAAVQLAREAGLEVVIATGRTMSECRHALQAIEHEGLVIAAGGSLLCDGRTEETLHRFTMLPEVVEEAMNMLVGSGIRGLILKDAHVAGYDYLLVGDAELDAASRWWFETLPVRLRFANGILGETGIGEDRHFGETVRAGAVGDRATLEPLAAEMNARFKGPPARAMIQHWSAVTETEATGSATHLLEIFAPGVDKWRMIENVYNERGVKKGRVAAIGDGLNDIMMIENAALGVAMANANSGVLKVADRQCGHHEQDGVTEAIERIVAGEW